MNYSLNHPRLSLSDEVYLGIIEKINSKELKVGDKLPSENKLCKMFNVSRTSVRAALQNLQGSGIIITMQGVGSFVHRVPSDSSSESNDLVLENKKTTDIKPDEFKEFFEFRQAIEFKAIEFFVRRATKADIDTLKELRDKILKAAELNDKKLFSQYDFKFHMAVIKGSKNLFLYEAMLDNKEIFYHYLEEITRLSDKSLFTLAEEHVVLCNYLLERKPKQAKDYLFCDNTYYHVAYFN